MPNPPTLEARSSTRRASASRRSHPTFVRFGSALISAELRAPLLPAKRQSVRGTAVWRGLTSVRDAVGGAGPKSSSLLLLSSSESPFGLPSGRSSSGAGGGAGPAIRFFFAAASSSSELSFAALAACSSSSSRLRFARMCSGIWGPANCLFMFAIVGYMGAGVKSYKSCRDGM
jgi:hypothetical protein